MGPLLGELVPLALGVAISPIPVIALILMLLAPRAGAAAGGFTAGWVVGIVAATGAVVIIAGQLRGGDLGSPSGGATRTEASIRLGLGLVLLVVGARQWRRRPHGDRPRPLPGWMAAVDRMNMPKGFGLGFVLAALNPKDLLLCVVAGAEIAAAEMAATGQLTALALFTLVASSTVVVPMLGYALARDHVREPLDAMKRWLQAKSETVLAVLILAFGLVLVGQGLAELG